MKTVVVSGGFDPVHIGHLQLFEEAKKLGDHLIVIVNSDKFLQEKKNFVFMPSTERKQIILGFSCVDEVIDSIDKDHTVSKTLQKLSSNRKIDIFANGGDRKDLNDIPEYEICRKNNIEMVFDVGGGKIQSSSDLTKQFNNYKERRPWGSFENLFEDNHFLVKKLLIKSGGKLSLQFHNHRTEKWTIVKGSGKIKIGDIETLAKYGDTFSIDPKEIHTIENTGKEDLEIIEVQLGKILSEDDITRLEDRYGRN
tara:strand:- start:423 stop:1181 length:759 start_codon:yes stop_codon:yes gene_type:complete